MGPDEQRLTEALRQEADRVVLAPDALARIQHRLAAPVSRPARTPRRLALGAAAVGLAAALALVAGVGLRPDTAPPPVQSPGPVPSVAPTIEANPGRGTVDVYRVRSGAGAPRLAVEPVPVTTPYDFRQAMDALFGLKPLNEADDSSLDDGRNVVRGTRETPTALVLDMSQVDQVSRPASHAVAEVWVQAWVRTLQSAYNSDLPVLITLDGHATTLYGTVDTSRPIASAEAPTLQDRRIFVPRPDSSVTSPVSFGANLPGGRYQWTVTDAAGHTVNGTGWSGSAGYGGPGFELKPGRYRASVVAERGTGTPSFRSSVDFQVTGLAAPTTTGPVVDPPTTLLQTRPVYYAQPDGAGLVGERRTLRDATTMVQDYLAVPPTSSSLVISGFSARNRVRSVGEQGGRLVVDFAELRAPRLSLDDRSLERQAAAFARTVQGITGRSEPVVVTLDGKPAPFLRQGRIDSAAAADVTVAVEAVPYPQVAHDPGHAEIVGRAGPRRTATWRLEDAASQQTLFEGPVPALDQATGDYAFRVDVPAGRYLLEVTVRNTKGIGFTTLVDLSVG